MRLLGLVFTFMMMSFMANASYIFIPMDDNQSNHMKSYGIAYWVLEKDIDVWWLLNYQGGSFAFPYSEVFEKECKLRDVTYQVIPDGKLSNIMDQISNPEVNMDAVKLEVAPKIAVYSPTVNSKGEEIQPWDDAVTLVLTYAEIPYDVIYDKEVMEGRLDEYDWLHLHHEDFTGQYGKFYRSNGTQQWYLNYVKQMEALATELGFEKVSELKLAVAQKFRDFVGGGGFMFAMCSATDTYDIALASEGNDICAHMYDGDPADPRSQQKLDYSKTFAFKDFQLEHDPLVYEYSSIDVTGPNRGIPDDEDYFVLFDFSAKWDQVPTMLTQNHTRTVKGFMGQTTAFKKEQIKSDVLILGENNVGNEARYIHGSYGYGTWTFYGGHDPEDYRHYVNDPPTDLNLHPNSPGYRLILNNILFPAAKKKDRRT